MKKLLSIFLCITIFGMLFAPWNKEMVQAATTANGEGTITTAFTVVRDDGEAHTQATDIKWGNTGYKRLLYVKFLLDDIQEDNQTSLTFQVASYHNETYFDSYGGLQIYTSRLGTVLPAWNDTLTDVWSDAALFKTYATANELGTGDVTIDVSEAVSAAKAAGSNELVFVIRNTTGPNSQGQNSGVVFGQNAVLQTQRATYQVMPSLDYTVQKDNADLSTSEVLRSKWPVAQNNSFHRNILLEFDLAQIRDTGNRNVILYLMPTLVENGFTSLSLYGTQGITAPANYSAVDAIATSDHLLNTLTFAQNNEFVQLNVTSFVNQAKAANSSGKVYFVMKQTTQGGALPGIEFASSRNTVHEGPYLWIEPDNTVAPTPEVPVTGGTTYYVSTTGDDSNSGTTPQSAWRTLDKVNSIEAFLPGDQILLKRGDIWNGTLEPKGNGTADLPIILGAYGEVTEGYPMINGGGMGPHLYQATVMIENQSNWIIRDLEVTNYQAGDSFGNASTVNKHLGGIFVFSHSGSMVENVVVTNCYVHDVISNTGNKVPSTNNGGKWSGGILSIGFADPDATTDVKGGFDTLTFEYNTVIRVCQEGVRTTPCSQSRNIFLRNNYVEKVQLNAVVIAGVQENGIVEKNIIREPVNITFPGYTYYGAGCWAYDTQNALFQYNEVYGGVYGKTDGQAFDADNLCNNTVFQYNYSHSNQGGACLFMSNQRNSVYRYNVSAGDATGNGQEIFKDQNNNGNATGAPIIYNNTIYMTNPKNVTRYLFSSLNTPGSKDYVYFYNNIVMADANTYTTRFSKGTGIAGHIYNNLFMYEGMFGITSTSQDVALGVGTNYFGDAQLSNPEIFRTHDAISAESMGFNGIDTRKENALSVLREHVSSGYTPLNTSLIAGKGITMEGTAADAVLDENSIPAATEDIMGNAVTSSPDLGAMILR